MAEIPSAVRSAEASELPGGESRRLRPRKFATAAGGVISDEAQGHGGGGNEAPLPGYSVYHDRKEADHRGRKTYREMKRAEQERRMAEADAAAAAALVVWEEETVDMFGE